MQLRDSPRAPAHRRPPAAAVPSRDALAAANAALAAIAGLNKAHVDAKAEPAELDRLREILADVRGKTEQLLEWRVKSPEAVAAAQRLRDTADAALCDLDRRPSRSPSPLQQQQQQQQQGGDRRQQRDQRSSGGGGLPSPATVGQRLKSWPAVLRRLATGPSDLERFMDAWAKPLGDALSSVTAEEGGFRGSSITAQLPQPCECPQEAYEQLRALVLQLGGEQQQRRQRQQRQQQEELLPPVVQLVGVPGMGKSTLALKLALDLQAEGAFRGGVFYLRSPPKPGRADPQAAAAAALELQQQLLRLLNSPAAMREAKTPVELHTELLRLFGGDARPYDHLLVLDGVWDGRVVGWLRCSSMRGVVLVTARHHLADLGSGRGGEGGGDGSSRGGWGGLLAGRSPAPAEVSPAAEDDGGVLELQPGAADARAAAQRLVEAVVGCRVERLDTAKREVATAVLDKCDGNMLAAAATAHALQRSGTADAWRQALASLSAARPEGDGAALALSAVRLGASTLAAGNDDDRAAADAFALLAHVQARRPLPLPLLQALWEVARPDAACQHPDVEPLLDKLAGVALLRKQLGAWGDPEYSAHSVAYQHLRREPQEAPLPQAPTSALWQIVGMIPRALGPLAFSHRRSYARRRRWSSASGASGDGGGGTPTAGAGRGAAVADKLAVLLLGFGRPPAVRWAQQRLGVSPADGTPLRSVARLRDWAWDDPEVFLVEPDGEQLAMLGLLLREAKQPAKAEPFLRRELAATEELCGPTSAETAVPLSDLAHLLRDQGKLAEAEPLFRRTLAIRGQALGPDHPDTASAASGLADLLRDQGKLAEAEPLYERAAAVRQAALGPNHPETATALDRLADLLRERGKLAEAEPLYHRALAIRTEALDPDHPDTAAGLTGLGNLVLTQGKLGEAEVLFRQALGIREFALGVEHPLTAASASNLALLLQAQGNLGEAEALARRALAVLQDVQGARHPDTAHCTNHLALVLRERGRLQEAEELQRRALEVWRGALGAHHPNTATSLSSLAVVLRAQGRLSEADRLQRQALAALEAVLGDKHPHAATCLDSLAVLRRVQRRLGEAEQLQRRALEVRERVLGSAHQDTAASMHHLAMVLSEQGQLEEAERLHRCALEVLKEALGTRHPHTATCMDALAQLLCARGELAEAEPLQRLALDIRQQLLGDDHPDTASSAEHLRALLRHQGQQAAEASAARRAATAEAEAAAEAKEAAGTGASGTALVPAPDAAGPSHDQASWWQ